MSSKRLKQLTIIPSDLYVSRDADRQVRQIIDEMGRPGYVLVARQMGKTNLLLNARREIARAGDQFVYVDVSNIFPSLRELFRNIIDTAVSARASVGDLRERIAIQRERTARMPEHQEHESELIILLENLDGKLVICLDEVDALAKTKYSDNVFSFIRSVYFSGRTNVASFSRLTYLLSGVAEPSELIKNKSISPFNIGAKIYLGDFSLREISTLASRSSMPIEEVAVERVFYWTNGHPRLSWHLLSLIEDHLLVGEMAGANEVDRIVEEAYLTSFDLPPVDHIRTLVQDDREVRDALMSMHYGRSESLSAAVRTKLYLNGISATQSASGEVNLKNRILEAALSEEWLKEIESQGHSLRERAAAAYEREDYAQAVDLYKQLLSLGDEREVRFLTCTNLGLALYHMEDYEEAAVQLQRDPLLPDNSPALYAMNRYHLASTCVVLGRAEEARRHFQEVLELGNRPSFRVLYLKSVLNVASLELSDSMASSGASLIASQNVLSNKDAFEGVSEKEARVIRVAAHYLCYRAEEARNNPEAAERSLRDGLAIADDRDRITLLTLLAHRIDESASKRVALGLAVEALEAVRPALATTGAADALMFSEEHFRILLHSAIVAGDGELLRRVIFYLGCGDIESEKAHRIILYCVYRKFRTYTSLQLIDVLQSVLERFRGGDDASFRRSMLIPLCIAAANVITDEQIAELAGSFRDVGYKVSTDGVRGLLIMCRALMDAHRMDSADKLIAAFSERINLDDSHDPASFEPMSWELVSGFLSFLAKRSHDGRDAALALTTPLLDKLKKYPAGATQAHLQRSVVDGMIKEIQRFAKGNQVATVVRMSPKIGRNDLVKVRLATGDFVHGKFKKFEALLRSGQATLADVANE